MKFAILFVCVGVSMVFAQGTREPCIDPNNRITYTAEVDYSNSISCDEYYSPYCLKTDSTDQGSGGICTSCAIEGSIPGSVTGGSCACDARTQSCNLQGRCVDYTLLGRSCSSDGECRRSQTAANGRREIVEPLFCVKSMCKPCSPTAWGQYVGEVGVANITCGGFNEALSEKLGRYATESVLPGVSFTCDADGNIVYLSFGDGVISPVPDWTVGCQGCDPDTWKSSGSTTPTVTPSLSPTTSTASQMKARGIVLALVVTLVFFLA